MSIYKELIEDFFVRYEHPVVEPYILGFSGIDPPLKSSGGTLDHERLINLFGGDDNGHYHLTKEQLIWILEQMGEAYPPNIAPNQVISGYADSPINDYEIKGENLR